MSEETYLDWISEKSNTNWWNDSGNPREIDFAIIHGATGVTTNPVLSFRALKVYEEHWHSDIKKIVKKRLDPNKKAEELMRIVVTNAAKKLKPVYENTKGELGYVCAQVNPSLSGYREELLETAKRYHSWAPNITVKLPGTYSGLDVLGECISIGISCTITVSFSVPQVIAVAEKYRKAISKAKKYNIKPGRCFAVIMIGRLDDYLRDCAMDSRSGISESDIRQAGLAVTKRAFKIFRNKGYQTTLIVAALRGIYHMTELAGANIVMSISPKYQNLFLSDSIPYEEKIKNEIPADVIKRLYKLPEFVKAYEPDGMNQKDFISFGATQRTLSQFAEVGWKGLQTFEY